MSSAGKFIVFDGPDGCGKGTQLARIEQWLISQGRSVVRAKDPGGTEIGDRIRQVLLGHDLTSMAPRCEALLFMASRAQLVREIVEPALVAGKVVLGDRFISATCAYQVAAGFPRDEVIALGNFAIGTTWPDLTIVLDVPPEIGFERTGRKPHHAARRGNGGQLSMFDDAEPDAMERRPLDFHRRVRQLFLELPDVYPQPVAVIDGTRSPDAVFADVLETVQRALV